MLRLFAKIPWAVRLLIVALAAVAVILLVLFRGEIPGLVAQARQFLVEAIAYLEGWGPIAYYGAYGVATLVGLPASPFIVAGAAAFGKGIGFLGAFAALVLSLSLSHLLTTRLLRAQVARLLGRLGYSIPQVPAHEARNLTLLMRLTPGMPLVIQNYTLPMAGVPLSTNLVLTLPVQGCVALGFVFLGDAFTKGNVGKAVVGAMLLAAVAIGVGWYRKHRLKANREAIPTQS